MKERVLCYDFGGTGFRVGVAGREGIIFQKREDISQLGTNKKLDALAKVMGEKVLAESSTDKCDLIGIGIGGAGTWKGLMITFAPNSPIRYDIHFPTAVSEHFGLPVVAGNDIRAAVHGAAMYGHGKGKNLELVCAITYSTGNNIGILNRGLPYPGYSDLSQEVGHAHIVVEDGRLCGCGARGCFEAYLSGTAAANMAKEELKILMQLGRLKESTIYEVAKKDLEEKARKGLPSEYIISGVNSKHVYEALRQNPEDQIARWICETQKKYIATQLAHVSLHHRPQLIELFGGLTNQAELLFNPAIEDLRKNPIKYAYPSFEPPEIRITQLGDQIGLYGAAAMVFFAEKAGRLR